MVGRKHVEIQLTFFGYRFIFWFFGVLVMGINMGFV